MLRVSVDTVQCSEEETQRCHLPALLAAVLSNLAKVCELSFLPPMLPQLDEEEAQLLTLEAARRVLDKLRTGGDRYERAPPDWPLCVARYGSLLAIVRCSHSSLPQSGGALAAVDGTPAALRLAAAGALLFAAAQAAHQVPRVRPRFADC